MGTIFLLKLCMREYKHLRPEVQATYKLPQIQIETSTKMYTPFLIGLN